MYRQTGRQTDRLRDRKTGRQTDKLTDRKGGRQTDRQTYRQRWKDRLIFKHFYHQSLDISVMY